MTQRALFFRRALILLALSLVACGQEPNVVPATQVLVMLRSDFGSQLSRVEAVVYSADGEKRGDSFPFDLSSHPLPFSFSVVRTREDTTAFLVVATGETANGAVVEAKAIVSFVPRKKLTIELWLNERCLGRTCESRQTCLPVSTTEASCAPIPTLEGQVEASEPPPDASTQIEVESVQKNDAGAAPVEDSGDPVSGTSGAVADAGRPDAQDAGGDSTTMSASDVCLGSAGKAVCTDRVLSSCSELGQIERPVTCESARQCQLGIASKACAACDPGTRKCTGVRLERCSEDGSQWELVKSCASEALCNAIAGDCVAGTCTASTRVCMGSDLYGCNQELTALTRLKTCSANLCDQTNGECDVCTPNARTCNGSFAEACDNRGQTLTRTECAGALPKCTGNGVCVQCIAPGDCPAPSSQCQSASCSSSTARCGSTPKAAHATCTGGVCNGSGTCVECVDDSDCKSAGARKCSNSRCVACKSNADCGATFECNTSQICQKVSIAGTGTSCLSTAAPVNGMCGSYFCGVTPARFGLAFNPASACGPDPMFMCEGSLMKITTDCAVTAAVASIVSGDFRGEAIKCVKKNPNVITHGISDACLGCFVDDAACCNANAACQDACLNKSQTECDAAHRAAGCVNPLFTCSGLPSPL